MYDLSRAPGWATHLRSYNKRRFWKQHRQKERVLYESDRKNDAVEGDVKVAAKDDCSQANASPR